MHDGMQVVFNDACRSILASRLASSIVLCGQTAFFFLSLVTSFSLLNDKEKKSGLAMQGFSSSCAMNADATTCSVFHCKKYYESCG